MFWSVPQQLVHLLERVVLAGRHGLEELDAGARVAAGNDLLVGGLGVGDVIVFRNGAQVEWHVEEYVKKVAICRQTNPIWLGLAVRAVNKLKRTFFASRQLTS